MINLYKRTDVFRCNQEAHRNFNGRVSVHHVLKEKACYPQGCLYFYWRCVLLEKGQRCIQGYGHVGKKCIGCTYYADEKVHLQPTLLLKPDDYERFLDDLEQYETWLEGIRYKRKSVSGRIQTVKPWFEKIVQPGEGHTRLRGYLLVLKKGFIDTQSFDDTFYIRVSESLMRSFRFVPKMKVDMNGEMRLDRGRLVLVHPGKVDILSRGWGFPWTKEKALVAVRTATRFTDQPETCLACPWGALADIVDKSEAEERRFRQLYCLKGVAQPEGCYVKMARRIRHA
jgi:hypothetical protein